MLSASYVHPEFGYLCPTPRLRRLLRFTLLSILFATIIVTVWRGVDHARNAEGALAMLRVDSSGAYTADRITGAAPPILAPGVPASAAAAPVTTAEPAAASPKKARVRSQDRRRD
jgi:hypothetical protein